MKVTAGGPPISVSVVVVDPTAAVSHVDPAVVVTRVVPILELAYIEIAASTVLDDSGRYQYRADMTAVVDSTAIAFSRPVSSEFGFTDDYVYTFAKALVDSVGVTDVCTPVLVFLRDFTETLTATDAKVLSYSKSQTDAYTVSDSAPLFVVSKRVNDAFAMNDLADIADGIAFQFDEYTNNVVTLSDGTVIVLSNGYVDSVAPSDSTAFDVSRVTSDSISETDLLAISFDGAYTDSTTLVDNPAIGFSRPVSDSFGQTDAIVLNPNLGPSDSVSFTESGSMFVQSYADPTYFAEEYVGTSYTF